MLYIWLFHYLFNLLFLLLKNWLNRYFTWFIWFTGFLIAIHLFLTGFLIDFCCAKYEPSMAFLQITAKSANDKFLLLSRYELKFSTELTERW